MITLCTYDLIANQVTNRNLRFESNKIDDDDDNDYDDDDDDVTAKFFEDNFIEFQVVVS